MSRTIVTGEKLGPAIFQALGLPADVQKVCAGLDIQLRPNEPIRITVLMYAGDDLVSVPWHELLEKAPDER